MNPQLEPFLKSALLRNSEALALQRTLPSGFSDLDRVLPGGGWPIGALTEIMNSADEGIGELSLLIPAIAAASQSGQGVVLVNAPHIPFPAAWLAKGVALENCSFISTDNSGSTVVDGAKFVVGRVFAGDFLATGRQGHRVQSAAPLALGRTQRKNAGDFISLAP